MFKRFSLLAVVSLLCVVGCKSDSEMDHDHRMKDKVSMDACSHCPGNQTATAEGKCPTCGMPVADMKMK